MSVLRSFNQVALNKVEAHAAADKQFCFGFDAFGNRGDSLNFAEIDDVRAQVTLTRIRFNIGN
jgi:hypothetical protein